MDKEQLYINDELNKDTIYDQIDEYLKSRYDIVFNTKSHEYYIKLKKAKEWHRLNDKSLLIELTKKGIKIKKGELETYLGSNLIKHINPFEEYFKNLEKWGGKDHIEKLASYVSTENNKLFKYHLKKWFVRAVKCSLEEEYYNKSCIVLVHETENSGKSTFCRFLTPKELKNYSAENISHDKDGLSQLCKNIIINLDEIDQIDHRAIKAYKSMLSKTHINIRLPYHKTHSIFSRTCSFIGSTNKINFLKASSGDVRWICFELTDIIDFNYSKEIDIDKVWSQAYFLAYKDEKYNCDLTREDVIENKTRNEKYKSFSIEEDLINQLFEKSENREEFLTASQVTDIIKKEHPYISHISIGKELSKLGFKRINGSEKGNKGYMIRLKKK